MFGITVCVFVIVKMIFSNSFPSTGRKLMGIYKVVILEYLPGLSMIIMIDNF